METLIFWLVALFFVSIALYTAGVMLASLVGAIIVTVRGRRF